MHHIFGIRHHGPGSARSLRRALERLQPDLVLVEGPPDAEPVLPLLAHHEMQPPVALLVYLPEAPQQAVYYPLAVFSPEWQAISYALGRGLPVRLIDLPLGHQLGRPPEITEALELPDMAPPAVDADQPEDAATPLEEDPLQQVQHDPLGWLGRAAGYSDGERWWERMVEQRRNDSDLFAAVLEAMSALREAAPAATGREAQREAWMRRSIRRAMAEGFERIAVVCGAWHGPALLDLADEKADAALLADLPQVKTQATWSPWSYGRLALASGYGAGVTSPGWYDHLWHHEEQIVVRWMTRVARLLREEGLDISAAHAIEAVRLAESLATLREHPLPGLPELNEACRAVFCFGSDLPMSLIHERLIVNERLGAVPAEAPAVPLQQDLQREQKRLKIQPEAGWRDLDLDLRKPIDLERSQLLRRLNLLAIPWGQLQGSGGTGTFRETWRIAWQPEFSISLIEAGIWGNTVRSAATARAQDAAQQAGDLPALVAVVNQSLLADLPEAVSSLVALLQERSAHTSDTGELMAALVEEDRLTRTSLVNSLRYGNVRKTDAESLAHVVDGIVIRICIGLPGACASLNDDAAGAMFERIVAVNQALRLLQNDEHLASWHGALQRMVDRPGIHGLVAGRCCRILLEAGVLSADEAGRQVGLALSSAEQPAHAAAWVEGLLRGSGSLLVHDQQLFAILDRWVAELTAESFIQLLPLLRRTFSTFESAERRAIGEQAQAGRPVAAARSEAGIDDERGARVLPLVADLLGINKEALQHD